LRWMTFPARRHPRSRLRESPRWVSKLAGRCVSPNADRQEGSAHRLSGMIGLRVPTSNYAKEFLDYSERRLKCQTGACRARGFGQLSGNTPNAITRGNRHDQGKTEQYFKRAGQRICRRDGCGDIPALWVSTQPFAAVHLIFLWEVGSRASARGRTLFQRSPPPRQLAFGDWHEGEMR